MKLSLPRRRSLLLLLTLALLSASGCEGPRALPFSEDQALDAQLSGEQALAHVAAVVAMGPRPAGSEALERTRQYLESELAALGWVTQRQVFVGKTPQGQVEFVNLRARFGEKAWGQNVEGLLCSHYDTKPYEGFEFVGANDGGSSTGLLVEIARVLATRPEAATRLELVFFDGEEAFGTNINGSDGLYGSKHYAAEWLTHKASERPRWGLLLDMVGDADLNIRAAIRIPRQSIRDLVEARKEGYSVDIEQVESALQGLSRDLLAAAEAVGHRAHVGISADYIIDDHIPLNVVAGIPTMDLIDFEYAPWHTPADTMDKLSAESLEIVGKVTLRLVEGYLLYRSPRVGP